MAIYTSRYANPKLKSGDYIVVAISRGLPKYPLSYSVAGTILPLAPAGYLMHEYDREVFRRKYRFQLNKLGIVGVMLELERYQNLGKDIVLCCYEDLRNPELFCHRTCFAEWWLEQTGEVIQELEDTSANKWKKKEIPKAKEAEDEFSYQQMKLF